MLLQIMTQLNLNYKLRLCFENVLTTFPTKFKFLISCLCILNIYNPDSVYSGIMIISYVFTQQSILNYFSIIHVVEGN